MTTYYQNEFQQNEPAFYARISELRNWIENKMKEASTEGSNCLTSGDYITTSTITEAVQVTEPPSTESPNETENENPDTIDSGTIDIFEASAWNYLQLAVELCFLGNRFKMLLTIKRQSESIGLGFVKENCLKCILNTT